MSNDAIHDGPQAVLRLPKVNLVLLAYAKSVHDALSSNPVFASPPVAYATFASDVDAFDKAEAKAATKAKGMAKLRNAAKRKVVNDLRHYRDFVQGVAETQASPVDAAAIIASALMSVRALAHRNKAELAVTSAGVSGSALLDAKAVARKATYYWSFSLDQKVWSNAPDTMTARTVIAGLTPGQTYYFRFRALTPKKGLGDFSQIVSLLVP